MSYHHDSMTTTSLTPYLGEGLLNVGDFFAFESILHPIAIGSIAIVALFGYLRLSSNRTVAPLTIWDDICGIALGSVSTAIPAKISADRSDASRDHKWTIADERDISLGGVAAVPIHDVSV